MFRKLAYAEPPKDRMPSQELPRQLRLAPQQKAGTYDCQSAVQTVFTYLAVQSDDKVLCNRVKWDPSYGNQKNPGQSEHVLMRGQVLRALDILSKNMYSSAVRDAPASSYSVKDLVRDLSYLAKDAVIKETAQAIMKSA